MNEINLAELFANTNTVAIIRRLAGDLVAKEEIRLAPTSTYVSVRPKSVEHIAVFLHTSQLSIALDPVTATNYKSELPGSTIEPKTDATHYLHVPVGTMSGHYEKVLQVCSEAIKRAASGPDFTSKPGEHQKLPEAQYCEKCFMQLPNTGICESPSCA